MIRQAWTLIPYLACIAWVLHFVVSVWSFSLQMGFGWMHPDDRTGIAWVLSLVLLWVTSFPIFSLAGYGEWLNSFPVLTWLIPFAVNSLLATSLFFGILYGVGAAYVHRGSRRGLENE